ncbi:MAG: deoxyribodipyrimidine photo-lyase [Oligoflexales bacterium]|nr:deoxyribodipyrimidine photo-lyase [Oligoflexales bacterium]
MNKLNVAIVWFRNDLRLQDHAALLRASRQKSLIPLYIWDPETEGRWQAGEASRWWLHHSLLDLDRELSKRNSRLIILCGNRLKIFETLITKFKISSVFWNRSYEPDLHDSDTLVEDLLVRKGIQVEICRGNLITEPGEVLKDDGTPYLVYTAFWKRFLSNLELKLEPHGHKTESLPPLPPGVQGWGETLSKLNLLPAIPWDSAFSSYWKVSEQEAHVRLNTFLKNNIRGYQKQRDLPSVTGTSSLSPYLHFGQIHPARIFKSIQSQFGDVKKIEDPSIVQFCKELVWREFAHHLLFHFPILPELSMRKKFNKFPWKADEKKFNAWKKGMTGYPIVDAGMRQLWTTGWMHNRVRMIVASFLTKDLHIPWQEGAQWFWDTLLDADLANNTQGWQWTAGCGFDAAPFFRIFNPMTQGEKFDPGGVYIKTWCPELKGLPEKWIHKPWMAPPKTLSDAGLRLGVDYPLPIVDHKLAREYSLEAFKKLQN